MLKFKIKKLVDGVETEVEVSPEEYAKSILTSVQDSLSGSLKGFKEEISNTLNGVKELTKGIGDKISGIEERVGKIEKMPIKGAPNVNVISGMHKGYNLNHQGEIFKNNMKAFHTLNNEEAIDNFCKFMIDLKNGTMKNASPEDAAEIRKYLLTPERKAALNIGTDAQGGYLVPDEYQWDIIKLARAKSFALDKCSIFPMGSDTLKLPKELTNVTVAWDNETTITESEPTFDQLVLTCKDLDGYSIVSNALLADTAYDIASALAEQFSQAILLELDNQVLNGTGTPCSGVLTSAAGYSVVMSGDWRTAFSGITCDQLSEMESLIDSGYDDNLTYIFHKTIMHYIRTLQTGQGAYIYQRPSEGRPATIWENPVFLSTKGPKASESAANTAFGVLGNFKYFAIGRRNGAMVLEVDPYGLFTSKQTRYRMVTRWAKSIAQANAFCRLMTAAS